jgi:tetratricopeptide (TPR) repeat protein
LRVTRKQLFLATISLISLAVISFIGVRYNNSKVDDRNPDSLLKQADSLSWNNNWVRAEPLYHRAELLYAQQHRPSKSLYAHVSQIPPNAESSSLNATIFGLTEDLARPEAADPETRLRILTIRGMLEVNYDAASTWSTWTQVAELARHLNHFELASRAVGEQGIAAFILGDIGAAKKDVLEAWTLAKVLHDPAASVRYASVYGAGLVELHRYKEALTPLDEAIKITTTHPEVAYPTIAVNSKIDALRGLQQYNEALALSRDALAHLPNASLKGHEFQILMSRAEIYEDLNQWDLEIADCNEALNDARTLSYWRGITQVGGFLALAYEHRGKLPQALTAIDEAIEANTHIPDELYFVPKNMAIKAEIKQKLGTTAHSARLKKRAGESKPRLCSITEQSCRTRQHLKSRG